MTAIDELDEHRNNKLHDMTIAARASKLDEKEFKTFINSLK